MNETTIKLTAEDTITKTTTETIDLKPLKGELIEIDSRLESLAKQPDEILTANDTKFSEIRRLEQRKEEINNLLKIK
jgi:hypothetical protein